MIGQIRGTVLEKQPPQLLIDVHGVGYEIDTSMSTFYRLPDIGNEVILHTHLVVREDAHHLYGFYDRKERTLFRILLKVNGVGPRLALTILSSMTPDEFVHSLIHQDTESLVRLPGVGKKTAERLMIEMRDKISDWKKNISSDLKITTNKNDGRQRVIQDTIAALIALGFKREEATRTATKLEDGALSSEEMIRLSLREIVT